MRQGKEQRSVGQKPFFSISGSRAWGICANLVYLLVESSFYVAGGVVATGLLLAEATGFSIASYWPLWLGGTLGVYSLHKLIKYRRETSGAVRVLQCTILVASCILISIQLVHLSDPVLVFSCAGAVALALLYAHGVPRFVPPLKRHAPLKTSVPALTAFGALCLFPLIHSGVTGTIAVLLPCAWCLALLFFNVLWCDVRDMDQDEQNGIRSVPLRVGKAVSVHLLRVLQLTAAMLGVLAFWAAPAQSLPLFSATIACVAWMEILIRKAGSARDRIRGELLAEALLYCPLVGLVF